MPTQTFFHLPKEKQERIMKAAKDEFSTYSFYDASINRIIKKAEISRGSFYLYFENKEDLFMHLLSQYKNELGCYMLSTLNNEKCDIFTLHLKMFDFITTKVQEEEHHAFLSMILTSMDIRLATKLMHFIDPDEITQEQIQLFSQVADLDKLNLDPQQNDLEQMLSILKSIFANQIVAALNNPSTIERERNNLMRKLELLKTGFLK